MMKRCSPNEPDVTPPQPPTPEPPPEPEPTPEEKPQARINYEFNLIAGLVPQAKYTVNNINKTASENGTIPITQSWYGGNSNIVKIGVEDNNTTNSMPQTLAIPAIPKAPNVTVNTFILTGVTTAMEFTGVEVTEWTPILDLESDGTFNLPPNRDFEIRYKFTSTSFASSIKSITTTMPE